MAAPRKEVKKWEPLWQQIKSAPTGEVVSILCHVAAAKSIKKGVINQKDDDLGFKILNDIEQFRLVIKVELGVPTPKKATIHFSLKSRFGLVDAIS